MTLSTSSAVHSTTMRAIDWPAASIVVQSAAEHAQQIGIRVNIAVVDVSGNLVAFLRMHGAPLHSIDIAIDKAYTATSFGLPTSLWTQVLQSHSQAVREGLVRRPRFIAFGGGLPIIEGGDRIGGVGVSGGSEDEDGACAQAGLRALDLAAT